MLKAAQTAKKTLQKMLQDHPVKVTTKLANSGFQLEVHCPKSSYNAIKSIVPAKVDGIKVVLIKLP